MHFYSAVDMRLQQQERHHHHERSLSRSSRLNDNEQDNKLCETKTIRIPWYEALDHLCRQLRYTLSDNGFCIGRPDPCFTCKASPPEGNSAHYEMRQCRPTGKASYYSCANEANFCRNEWNYTDANKCPVNAQIVDGGLTGMGCCHQRVEMGQQVSSLIR